MEYKTYSKIKSKNLKKSLWRENIEAILIAIVLALFIRTFIIQAFKIPSGSMLETLQIGDHILVNKFIYGIKLPFKPDITLIPIKNPERDDIVVFEYPEDPSKDFIKRVVAVEGDTIKIIDKTVYINDKKIADEPWVEHKDFRIFPAELSKRDNMQKILVPANKLFVMGDNRDSSLDSRFWGFVDLDQIKGKAFIIYWSWDKNNSRVRWNRIGDLLL